MYVYDLPPRFNAHYLPSSPLHHKGDARYEMELLHERLLNSKHRTVGATQHRSLSPATYHAKFQHTLFRV